MNSESQAVNLSNQNLRSLDSEARDEGAVPKRNNGDSVVIFDNLLPRTNSELQRSKNSVPGPGPNFSDSSDDDQDITMRHTVTVHADNVNNNSEVNAL